MIIIIDNKKIMIRMNLSFFTLYDYSTALGVEWYAV
jgi:hypothetical protein